MLRWIQNIVHRLPGDAQALGNVRLLEAAGQELFHQILSRLSEFRSAVLAVLMLLNQVLQISQLKHAVSFSLLGSIFPSNLVIETVKQHSQLGAKGLNSPFLLQGIVRLTAPTFSRPQQMKTEQNLNFSFR